MRKYLVNYKIKHVSGPGQKANTRAHAIIDRFKSKVNLSADKHKAARNALESLDPDGSLTLKIFSINWSHRFLVLTSQDMVFLNADPDNSDEEGSSSKGKRGGTRKRKRQEEQLGEGHRTSSWIWRMPALNADQTGKNQDNDPFNVTVHIEWAKTKARSERWQEEVLLLKEEMRRAIVDMEWRAQQWTNRAHGRPNVSPDLLQGITAYAYKQAGIQTAFAASYAQKWAPILRRHGFDFSFASKYEITDRQDPKGKKKASTVQINYDEPETEWESEDDNLN